MAAAPRVSPSSRPARRDVLALILVSALARLLFAGSVGLSVDESYSVAISRS